MAPNQPRSDSPNPQPRETCVAIGWLLAGCLLVSGCGLQFGLLSKTYWDDGDVRTLHERDGTPVTMVDWGGPKTIRNEEAEKVGVYLAVGAIALAVVLVFVSASLEKKS